MGWLVFCLDSLVYKLLETRDYVLSSGSGAYPTRYPSTLLCKGQWTWSDPFICFLELLAAPPFIAGSFLPRHDNEGGWNTMARKVGEVKWNDKIIKIVPSFRGLMKQKTPRHCFKSGSFQLCNWTPWQRARSAVIAWERVAFSGPRWKFQVYEAFMSGFSGYLWIEGLIFFL